jgi:hypothetical protein
VVVVVIVIVVIVVVTGVLLTVPFKEQPVAGIQKGSKMLPEVDVRIRTRDATGQHLEVTRNFPVLHPTHSSVVRDVLRIEQLQEGGEDHVEVRRIDPPGDDQVSELLQFVPDDLPRYLPVQIILRPTEDGDDDVYVCF